MRRKTLSASVTHQICNALMNRCHRNYPCSSDFCVPPLRRRCPLQRTLLHVNGECAARKPKRNEECVGVRFKQLAAKPAICAERNIYVNATIGKLEIRCVIAYTKSSLSRIVFSFSRADYVNTFLNILLCLRIQCSELHIDIRVLFSTNAHHGLHAVNWSTVTG